MTASQFEWRDDYYIGHETIDSQHKGLLELGRLLEEVIERENELDE